MKSRFSKAIGGFGDSARNGVVLAELIATSVVLIVVMTFVTSICYRIHLTWKDVQQQRIAMGELSSQLDELSSLDTDALAIALDELEASDLCKQGLDHPVLSSSVAKDSMGTRISLQLNWQRKIKHKPVKLSAWIIDVGKREADDD